MNEEFGEKRLRQVIGQTGERWLRRRARCPDGAGGCSFMPTKPRRRHHAADLPDLTRNNGAVRRSHTAVRLRTNRILKSKSGPDPKIATCCKLAPGSVVPWAVRVETADGRWQDERGLSCNGPHHPAGGYQVLFDGADEARFHRRALLLANCAIQASLATSRMGHRCGKHPFWQCSGCRDRPGGTAATAGST